jgi:type 1 fimbriae regulatory protein FimB
MFVEAMTMNNNNPTINQLQVAANDIKHMSAEMLEEILQLAMETNARDHSLLCSLTQHMMRASEAAGLRMDDINDRSHEITIRRKKGSLTTTQQLASHRGKPCLDEVRALKRWLVERKANNEPSAFVWASRKGGALVPITVNRIFLKYAEQVNDARTARGAQPIPSGAMRVHSIRHTMATLAADKGLDPYKLALRAGWASLSSALIYTHGSQELAGKAWQEKAFEIFA